MSPFQLFLYVLAVGFGLFLTGCLYLAFWFLWNVVRGIVAGNSE